MWIIHLFCLLQLFLSVSLLEYALNVHIFHLFKVVVESVLVIYVLISYVRFVWVVVFRAKYVC